MEAIDQHGVGQRPQMLGRLELGRVRREKQQVHMVRRLQTLGAVPARSIQHQHDLLLRAGLCLPSESSELRLEERDAHARRQMKQRPSRRRLHKAHQIAPLIAMLDRSQRTLLLDTPDLVQKGFEPNAVLVYGPELDGGLREGRGDLAQQGTQTRLEGGLRLWIGLDMAGTGLEEMRADLPEGAPTRLASDDTAETRAQPPSAHTNGHQRDGEH
jgi:hypothetical protein